ncbi:MAG: Sua5/YciO/YrdC/YwlC family protein, partial [Rhizomicrobium sp.]
MSNAKVTTVCKPDADGIAAAADALQKGALAAFPTETVYGLGADATNGTAVAAIYAAKGRPSFNPLIVHVKNKEHAAEYVTLSELSKKLIDTFWPGPLTLV